MHTRLPVGRKNLGLALDNERAFIRANESAAETFGEIVVRHLRANLRAAEQSLLRTEEPGERTDAEALHLASVMPMVRPNIRRALTEINSAIQTVDDMISGGEGDGPVP